MKAPRPARCPTFPVWHSQSLSQDRALVLRRACSLDRIVGSVAFPDLPSEFPDCLEFCRWKLHALKKSQCLPLRSRRELTVPASRSFWTTPPRRNLPRSKTFEQTITRHDYVPSENHVIDHDESLRVMQIALALSLECAYWFIVWLLYCIKMLSLSPAPKAVARKSQLFWENNEANIKRHDNQRLVWWWAFFNKGPFPSFLFPRWHDMLLG